MVNELDNVDMESQYSLFIFYVIDEAKFLYQDLILDSKIVSELLIRDHIVYDGLFTHQDLKCIKYKLKGRSYPYRFYRKIPNQIRLKTLDRYNHRCNECRSEDYLEIDHIFPWSLGGLTELSNLQVLCKKCNSAKNNSI